MANSLRLCCLPSVVRCSRRFRLGRWCVWAPGVWALGIWALGVWALSASSVWAQRELTAIPDPSPEFERSTFQVGEGLDVNLFVSDPTIAKPIHMNFDAEGNLWIASSEVYPHIVPGAPATDKIIVVRDTDGDGVVDESRVFADGLLIPTGIAPGDGGCYVANSTELIHLSDTDGDGKADRRRVILSGFGTEDTHHLLHTLRWGPDGCLYMNQSIYIHSHIETPHGVRRMNGGGIWRFRPETRELDVFCLGFVNPWGHHFDRWGQSFATDGAYGEGINYVFPGSVFVTSPGATRILHGLNPGSPKHCGLEIVSGSHFPESWRGTMVTNDFRANRVSRFFVEDDRSAYRSRQEADIVRTDHVAFRPIDAKMGPDGALYIADWYNPIIQHGEVDFRDERRDHVHGRIWRVTAQGRETLERPQIVGAPIDDLFDLLTVSEDWVRLYAKLELKGRGAEQVVPALEAWLDSLDPGDPEYEHHRLEGLWVLQNLGVVDVELLEAVAQSPRPEARAAALRVAASWARQFSDRGAAWFVRGIRDEHPRVRLEAVRGLAVVGTPEAAEWATTVLVQPMDEFLDFALWVTLRELKETWLPELLAGRLDFDGDVNRLTYALQAVEAPEIVEPLLKLAVDPQLEPSRRVAVLTLAASRADVGALDRIVVAIDATSADEAARFAALEAIARATSERRVVPSVGLEAVLAGLDSSDANVRSAAVRIAGWWQVAGATPLLLSLAQSAEEDGQFNDVLEALVRLGTAESRQAIESLLDLTSDLTRKARVIGVLARVDLDQAAMRCAAWLSAADQESFVEPAMGPVLAQQQGAEKLIAALEGKKISADIARVAIRVARAAPRPDDRLIESLRNLGGLAEAGWKLNDELLTSLINEVNASGDAARGQAIYRRSELQCVNCHAIAGAGGRVGPDLVSIGASAPVDYLIESLLDPAAKVKEGYHSTVIETVDGGVITGIQVTAADGVRTLRQADGRVVRVLEDDIAQMADGRSLMPDGTVDALTRTELVDLVTFLSRLGKVGDYSVDSRPVVRSWQTLVWTESAHRLLNRTSHDSAALDKPELTWRPVTSRVDGGLPIGELTDRFSVHPGIPPTAFVRFELQVTSAGLVSLDLPDDAGLALWVDGVPATLADGWSGELGEGLHRFTISIDTTKGGESLEVALRAVESGGASVRLLLDSGEP